MWLWKYLHMYKVVLLLLLAGNQHTDEMNTRWIIWKVYYAAVLVILAYLNNKRNNNSILQPLAILNYLYKK